MSAKRRPAVRTAVRAPVQQRSLELGRIAPSARSLGIGFALAALALGSYALARWTPLFAIRSVEVVGVDRATSARVRTALGELEGESLVALRADAVQRRVSRLPEVLSASHDRAFPHTLVVFVRPERPVGVLRRGDEAWLVSARARVIAPLRLGERSALPRIWAGQQVAVGLGALVSDPDTLRAIRTLALRGIGSLPAIRTARIERGDVMLVLRSGLELRLGHGTDLPLKLAIAARILPRIDGDASGETLYLDVNVPERPVTGSD